MGTKRRPHSDYAGYKTERKMKGMPGFHVVMLHAKTADIDADSSHVLMIEADNPHRQSSTGRILSVKGQKKIYADMNAIAQCDTVEQVKEYTAGLLP